MSKIQHSSSVDDAAKQWRLRKTVVMVGMMGAGKTAVGRAVAAKLGVSFLDSDAEIERAANLTVPEIFARNGEPFFREREAQVVARLLESESGILSTGGGVYLSQLNRNNIADRGIAVWLDAPLDLLWSRVRHRDTRPLLRTDNPRETLAQLYEARVPLYAKAELRVPCTAKLSVEETAQRVIKALATRADVLEQQDA